jgi:hypothetical protein
MLNGGPDRPAFFLECGGNAAAFESGGIATALQN